MAKSYYRDPYLSLWQSAAAEVGATFGKFGTLADSQRFTDLMSPVGAVFEQATRTSADAFGAVDFQADSVVGDCAKTAAKFLWAEITRNAAKAQFYADELNKAVCDALGWSTCLATYLAFKTQGGVFPYRDHQNIIVPVKDRYRLGIVGDWGTGEDAAVQLLTQVKACSPDALLHLGDIYYSGTQDEVKHNFLEICQLVFGANFPLFTLCGNHDMYSGGNGYYWLVDQIGQRGSYFALRNTNWQLLAMDTGHNDCNPLTVSTNLTSLNGTEVPWHLNQIQNPAGRKTILLSHHPLFSAFAAVGKQGGRNYGYNPNLFKPFAHVLDQVEWWFWGHEHTLAVYDPYLGLKRGRCVGSSAVPVFTSQQSYTLDKEPETLEPGKYPSWVALAQLGNNGTEYNHGFAVLDLDGKRSKVEYYQVPLGGQMSLLWKESGPDSN
jgi:hypothetical protein